MIWTLLMILPCCHTTTRTWRRRQMSWK
jgi:hypothetical protein